MNHIFVPRSVRGKLGREARSKTIFLDIFRLDGKTYTRDCSRYPRKATLQKIIQGRWTLRDSPKTMAETIYSYKGTRDSADRTTAKSG